MKNRCGGFISCLLTLCLILVSCTPASSTVEEAGDVGVHKDLIRVGFSQLGAESDWRVANSESIQSTLTREAGYQLFFEDAQQKQSNQAMAIRRFIQQGVDYIVLAPVTEVGWENVLSEAKRAKIPVILVDRNIAVKDQSLYTCWIGSNFRLEADKVTAWMEQYFKQKKISPSRLRIGHLQGTPGASAQIGRSEGLSVAARKNHWKVVATEDGDFTQAKGKEVTTKILNEHKDVNVIYSENDNMALGAIEAIEASGRKVGKNVLNGDIMVVSFDGVNTDAMQKLWEGKIACIGECYPMFGSKVSNAIDMLQDGRNPDKLSFVSEGIYSADATITQITVGKKDYPVTIVTSEWIMNRSLERENG